MCKEGEIIFYFFIDKNFFIFIFFCCFWLFLFSRMKRKQSVLLFIYLSIIIYPEDDVIAEKFSTQL